MAVIGERASAPGARLQGMVLAGIAGAGVDFLYATWLIVSEGRSFHRFWRGVAIGWGKPAAELGWVTTVIGLATHFAIGIAMAAAFALAAARLPRLYERPVIAGVVYGLALYAVMWWVVLPLRWPQKFPAPVRLETIPDILSHVGVGLAIVLVLRWFARRA